MAENDLLTRLLDAGMTFTALTQARAEELIRDLVRAGAVQAEQAQEGVDELLARSRRNSERVIDAVRSEIDDQLGKLDLATRADLERLVQRFADVAATVVAQVAPDRARASSTTASSRSAAPAAVGSSSSTTAPARKAAAKKTTAKKATAKKTAGKKAAAKKATGQEVDGQEGDRQEVDGQEDLRQEGGRQEGAAPRSRPAEPGAPPRHPSAGASTPSWCAAAWSPAASRPGRHRGRAGHRVRGAGAKAARLVAPDEPVVVAGDPPRFVSRGGEKLAAALDRFAVDPGGVRALDAGASTGGFTDCLLQRGAARVVAVDVGYGQLHERLRADDRVEVHERTNVRDLAAGDLGAPFPLVVADLSFISLRTVLASLARAGRAGRRPRAAGEAAVRGRAGRGVPRAGRDPRPRGVAPGPRRRR